MRVIVHRMSDLMGGEASGGLEVCGDRVTQGIGSTVIAADCALRRQMDAPETW